jgi:predicted ribosomally synthesized peptide with SipW-like signal peptide
MKNFSFKFSGALAQRLVLVAAVTTGALSLVAGHGTLAFFTTQVSSTPNTFTAGTLRLFVGDVNEAPFAGPAASSITFANMKPGDIVYAPIEMANDGTLPARYGIKYTTSIAAPTVFNQDLAPGLTLAIKASAGGTGTRGTVALAAATACSAANWGSAGVWGADVRVGAAMVAGAGQTVTGVASLPTAAGNGPAQGGRDLAVSARETLCVQVTFTEPAVLDNTYNNATNAGTGTNITFVFDGLVQAAQLTNNP